MSHLTYAEAMDFLEKGQREASRLGLEKYKDFLAHLGSPEAKIPTIHVAGTNGKGSTCAYTAYILASQGLRVGLYSSPYVYDFGERIRVLDGRDAEGLWYKDVESTYISPEEITKQLNRVLDTVKALGIEAKEHPNHFEMLTTMAFLHFVEHDCDAIVLETGLGGRLDATNIIPAPKTAVITAIGLDHVERLGNTHLAIAKEKAGILKEGTETLLLYHQEKAVQDKDLSSALHNLFQEIAEEKGIDFVLSDPSAYETVSRSIHGQEFVLEGKSYKTALLPAYEVDNAVLAMKTVKAFYPEITEEAIRKGLLLCYWPARMEKLLDEPLVIIDGGHNPQGARALRESLDLLLPADTKEIHLCAMMKDKEQEAMFREILKGGKIAHIYCSEIENYPRATPKEELAAILDKVIEDTLEESLWPKRSISQNFHETLEALFEEAVKTNAVIVCWGTFYHAKNFRDTIKSIHTSRREKEQEI